MRIFIGLTDVANINATYAKGFKALGHQVFSAVWNKSYFYPDAEYDLIIDKRQPESKRENNIVAYIKIAFQLVQLFKSLNCDLFIIYAPAVLPSNLYYPVLKLLGKKIITPFWGSDIRYWYAFAEEMKTFGVQDEMSPFFEYAKSRSGGSFWDKQRTVKVAEKYSDLIVSQPDCAQLQTRPYMRSSVPLDLSQYKFNVPGRVKPLILHAPSVPEAKGTDIVLNVIKELAEEGLEFEFHLIEKMPNKELRDLLADSDIVVDELYATTVGGLSAEAMATGNAVLVRYMVDYCKVPEGCPAINVNKFTLKDNLRQIILDVDRRKKLAYLGRPYVENTNDHIKICKDLLSWLEQKDNIDYDFHPTFHKNFKIPEQIFLDEKKESGKRWLDFYKTLLSTGTTKKKQD
jgi:glycosyltransferase involved in cell wall biosynthesis